MKEFPSSIRWATLNGRIVAFGIAAVIPVIPRPLCPGPFRYIRWVVAGDYRWRGIIRIVIWIIKRPG